MQSIPWPPGIDLGLYVMRGSVRIGGEPPLHAHYFASLSKGDAIVLAATDPTDVVLLGGPTENEGADQTIAGEPRSFG
jgi:redox-sensitive bicupin YhaK (pirin superfamily)